MNIQLKRRELLKFIALTPIFHPMFVKQSWSESNSDERFIADVKIDLSAQFGQQKLFPNQSTSVMVYTGQLRSGNSNALIQSASYLGPTFRFRPGQKVQIDFNNQLNQPCITHWHGLHVPESADGHPRFALSPGQSYRYQFTVQNRAGMYFYHSHTHHLTGEQVYRGLAGLILVNDAEEEALKLPQGEYEIPLVIQDRRFDTDSQLRYVHHMPERMQGFLGDQILVNGVVNPQINVATRAYRLRLLNGSNARIYKLSWSDNRPLIVIGCDGGLLERPISKPYVMLAPGERLDLWVDFSGKPLGSEIYLKSLNFTMPMMHGGMMGNRMRHRGMGRGPMMMLSALPNGSEFNILKVKIVRVDNIVQTLPEKLTPICRYRPEDAINQKSPNIITLSMQHMSALLNSKDFQLTETDGSENYRLNSLYIIQLDNQGHGMMQMPHPIHFHGQQFQILKRESNSSSGEQYATVNQGFIDEGWKDTVLVMPGERVTILKRFDDYEGLFLYHCHNLEHEDLGMMRNFRVMR